MSKIALLALLIIGATVQAFPFTAVFRLDPGVQVASEGTTHEAPVGSSFFDSQHVLDSGQLPFNFVTTFKVQGKDATCRCMVRSKTPEVSVTENQAYIFPLGPQLAATVNGDGDVLDFSLNALNDPTDKGVFVGCGSSTPGKTPFDLYIQLAHKDMVVYLNGKVHTGTEQRSTSMIRVGQWFPPIDFLLTVPIEMAELGHTAVRSYQLNVPWQIAFRATAPWVPVYKEGEPFSVGCSEVALNARGKA